MRMCRIVICDVSGSTIFFPHYLMSGTILERKNPEHRMFVLIILYSYYLKHFSFYEEFGEI